MAEVSNILVVSDLHFGEELLPGASSERRRAVELGDAAFREFLRYHAARRSDGRPWRLVIAGDLFDFMSVVVASTKELPARSADERRLGLGRGVKAGVVRVREICEHHVPLLADLVRFAAAGHTIEVIVGNHDVELLEPEVIAEFERQLRSATPSDVTRSGRAAADRALARIRVVPWFIYVPGVAWIEHGHVYDEGCSFEFNLAPTDPKDGRLVYNADYAAIRYLGRAVPDLDPHGIEEWGFSGYLRYAWELGHSLVRPGCGSRTRGSRGRSSGRARCISRCAAAIADAGSIASASSRSPRPAACRSIPRVRSIGSRARRSRSAGAGSAAC